MPVQWTQPQLSAIRTVGKSLLVSAAAGSGKTAVLAERCAYLVCDAPDPCDVDELLVVTFTESAAAEMRGRIHKALAERVAETAEPSPRLLKQLALIEYAPISTIHGFCSRLLRQNFSAAGVDPQFQIINPDEAALLRREVARALFDDRYERDTHGHFRAFIDAYGDGRDEALIKQVIQTHELLCSLAHPRKWVADSMKSLVDAADEPLKESDLGRALLAAIEIALNRLRDRCAAAIASMQRMKIFPGYVKRLQEWSAVIETWKETFTVKGFDALAKLFHEFDPPPAPPVKSGVPNKEQAKSLYDAIKSQLCEGDLCKLLAFSESAWRLGQQSVVPHAAVFFSLAEEFTHRYSQAKTQIRGLDFSDLERKALELLSNPHTEKFSPSPVAHFCHRQYKHVLVDEYQDINEIQDSILHLVSTECVADAGHYAANLFTVGDVKQSIYRFRLAEPKRFLDRSRDFRARNSRHGAVIDLRENFRSRPPLLDAINRVFERLMTEEAAEIDYDQTHRLTYLPSLPQPPAAGPAFPPIELHLLPRQSPGEDDDFDTTELEAAACARRILALTAEGSSRYGDIVLLLRSMQHKAETFARILRRHHIPVHNTGGAGLFEATEVRDLIALLNLLDNQRQDIPLAAFLRSPLAALNENALAQIRMAYDRKTVPFHQAVVLYAAEQSGEVATALAKQLARLSHWRDLSRQLPLADLIWTIFDQTGFLTYVAGQDDGPQRVANLLYLHQRAREFGSFLKQGLHRFMSFLGDLREQTDLSLPSISSEGEQSVRIMSIHRSKGLEFPIVFVPDLGKRHNLTDASGGILLDRRQGAGFKVVDLPRRIRYASLSWTLTHNSLRRQTLAEELRLLYVAMTRAKDRLVLVGSAKESTAATWAMQYLNHAGPLATDDILSAGSMLDWLGPVQAICGPDTIALTSYSSEDISTWSAATARPPPDEKRTALAALKPLHPDPPPTSQAAAAIARLEFKYPHAPFTTLRGATSPTAMKTTTPSSSSAQTKAPELPLPKFLSARQSLTGAQIGDATHLVLEHLDYHRPCDAADIESQITALVDRRFLTTLQAAAVDRSAILWLISTPLGARLKSHADDLIRELPFAAAAPTTSPDPADAVMIRGRIDLILPHGDGLAVVDYKTDRISAEQVSTRSEDYRSQIDAYRDVLERIARKPVTAAYLIFLHPRTIKQF